MEDANLENKVIKIISENLSISTKQIGLDSKIEDLSEDSIRLFGLIMALEKEFQTKVNYEDLIKIETVGDIINTLKTKF